MEVFNLIRPEYELVKVKVDVNMQVPFLLTEKTYAYPKYVGSPIFSPPETPNSSWKLQVVDDTTEIKIYWCHCNSEGKAVEIVDPVMVKMFILNETRQNVFELMHPSVILFSEIYAKFRLSKQEIINSGCQQADGSLTFCFKIYTHEKEDAISPTVPSGAVDLVDHLEQLFDKMNLSDVTFTISGREFPAHKNILAARSEYFAGMFNHPTKENLSGKIELKDIDPEVFHELLRFIYTDRLSSSAKEKMAAELFIAADKYLLEGLKIQCENNLLRNISPDYCAFLLLHGDLQNPSEYLKKAAKFFRRSPSQVMATDRWKKIKKESPTLLCDIYEFVFCRK